MGIIKNSVLKKALPNLAVLSNEELKIIMFMVSTAVFLLLCITLYFKTHDKRFMYLRYVSLFLTFLLLVLFHN